MSDNPLPGYESVSGFTQAALPAVAKAVQISNKFPKGEESERCKTFKGFRKCVQAESDNILNLMSEIVNKQGLNFSYKNKKDAEVLFEKLIDINDTILEHASISIDEAAGIKKTVEPNFLLSSSKIVKTPGNAASWNKKNKETALKKISLLAARNVMRPQLNFQRKVDNSYEPFVPIIKEKPNSLKPLAIILEETEYGRMFCHPYQVELDHFNPDESMLISVTPQEPAPLNQTPLVFVQNQKDLENLMNDLKSQKEFAVDLEHHSYRTYQGITCLMQISTRDTDYIVDTLELRNDLEILNEVFTNPKIVKVFHGADSDVEWLQRDFGVYIVNLFDTGQASRLLNFAHFSLAFLLKHYCKVESNKAYQLADWRIRPLPEEMILYAREDTHYLLYIYDRMKNELLQKGNNQSNILKAAFHQSRCVCEKRYEKPIFSEDRCMEVLKKSRKVFNSRQIHALKEIYKWRDLTARKEDESLGYVLPNHMLMQISEILPRELQGLLACCNPVPPLVRQNLNELHSIVFKARELSLIKTQPQELRVQVAVSQHSGIDFDSALQCPHDLSHLRDYAKDDSIPGLLDDLDSNQIDENVSCKVKSVPSISLFSSSSKVSLKDRRTVNVTQVQNIFKSFRSPYERFKLAKSSPKIPDSAPNNTNEDKMEQDVERIQHEIANLISESKQQSVLENSSTNVEHESNNEENSNSNNIDEDISKETDSQSTVHNKILNEKVQHRELHQNDNKKSKSKKRKKSKQNPQINHNYKKFVPYDYDKTDLKVFQGGAKNKRNEDFNPNRNSFQAPFRGKRKRNTGRGGPQSMTYNFSRGRGRNANQNMNWPKK